MISPHSVAKFSTPKKRVRLDWPSSRRLTCALLLVAASCLALPALAGSSTALPRPSGPYGVGVVDLPLQDPARPGNYSDGTTSPSREIMVRVWYPAHTSRQNPTTTYLDEISAAYFSTVVPNLPATTGSSTTTHGVACARFDCGRHARPVVLFSPGLQGAVAGYQTLIEDLASHGYVVFGVDSPDVSGVTVFPDGHSRRQVMPDQDDDDDTFDEWAAALATADLDYVARQLPRLNRDESLPFAGGLDLHAVAAVGHSIGGAAAVEACLGNPAIRMAINLDGSLRGERYKQPIHQPMLMVLADDHPDDPSVKTFLPNLGPRSAAVHIAGTGHWSFTDIGFLISANGGDTTTDPLYGRIAPTRAIHLTRLIVRSFLDTALRGEGGEFSPQGFRECPEISFVPVGR